MPEVGPDGIQPTEHDRRILAMVVTCATCSVSWDMDFDPAECTDPDHEHTVDWKVLPE